MSSEEENVYIVGSKKFISMGKMSSGRNIQLLLQLADDLHQSYLLHVSCLVTGVQPPCGLAGVHTHG